MSRVGRGSGVGEERGGLRWGAGGEGESAGSESAESERGPDYQDKREREERSGEDLAGRDEKRMRRGADSRIKKGNSERKKVK